MGWLRVSVLTAAVCLALAGACVEARTSFAVDTASDRDGPCWSYKAEDDCLDNECSWCKTTLLGATCVPASVGRLMPLAVANCNNPPKEDTSVQEAPGDDPKPKPQAVSCGDNDNKADCLDLGAQEGQCAWCKGDFMPASCVGLKAAEWIPETVAKCKLPPKPQQDALTKGHSKKRHHDDKKKDKTPNKCMDNKEKHDCTHLGAEEGDCAWCAGSYMPGQCLPTMVAQWIPEIVASCKGPSKHHNKAQATLLEVEVEAVAGGGKDKPKPKPTPPVSCGDNKEKHDCLDLGAEEGDCAWCAGDFMPPSCVSTQAAKWIPGTVATCKMPKKADSTEDADELSAASKHGKGKHGKDKKKKKVAATCMDNDNKKGCMRGSEEGDCAWCAGGFMPEGKCMPVMAAKFLPEMVAKCKLRKKDAVKLESDDEDIWYEEYDQEEQEEQEEQLGAGEEAPGDDPKPKPQAVSCGDNDNKADCLDLGAQEGQCAWCKGDFMPASCVGLKAAEWIPETVAKCKLPATPQQQLVAAS